MSENQSKQRMISLYKILSKKTNKDHYLTTNQIIEALDKESGSGVNRNTLTADIKLLIENGYEIEAIHSTQNRYYYTGHPFDVPELKLLIDAVASSKFISAKKSKELISKICTLTNDYDAEKLHRNIYLSTQARSDNKSGYAIVDVINDAIDQKNKISFQYVDYNTKGQKFLRHDGETYIVSPYALIYDGDYYYMIGWCDNRGKVENFRLDRIDKTPEMISGEYVEQPEDFRISEYRKTVFRMFGNGEPVEVTLQGEQVTMKGLLDQFGKAARIKAIDENTYQAKVKVSTSPTFYRWVFGWEGKMKITGPETVVEEYREMLRKAIEG